MRQVRLMQVFFVVLWALLLSACVSMSLPDKGSIQYKKISPEKRQAALRKLTHWKIGGAFSIQHQGKAEIANYNWQQSGRA